VFRESSEDRIGRSFEVVVATRDDSSLHRYRAHWEVIRGRSPNSRRRYVQKHEMPRREFKCHEFKTVILILATEQPHAVY
jgi:hypothetical protein